MSAALGTQFAHPIEALRADQNAAWAFSDRADALSDDYTVFDVETPVSGDRLNTVARKLERIYPAVIGTRVLTHDEHTVVRARRTIIWQMPGVLAA